MKNQIGSTWMTAVILGACVEKISAAVNLTYSGNGYGVTPVSMTYPTDNSGGNATRSGVFLGEIIMTAPSGSEFRTYCLSPAGTVGSGVYDLLTFDAANPGANPSTWSLAGGIENAAYLFGHFAGSVANNKQGAAMQLALMELLYDSTGLGSLTAGGLTGGRFQAPSVGAAVAAEVNNYIDEILSEDAGDIAAYYGAHPGYVLRPEFANGQDLISFVVPVPEAGTVMAGTLLLIPAAAAFFWRSRRPT